MGRRDRIVDSRKSPESFKKEKVNDSKTMKPLDLTVSKLSATMERKFPGKSRVQTGLKNELCLVQPLHLCHV